MFRKDLIPMLLERPLTVTDISRLQEVRLRVRSGQAPEAFQMPEMQRDVDHRAAHQPYVPLTAEP